MIQGGFKCKVQLFDKIEINGEKCHPVYAFLRSNSEDLKEIQIKFVVCTQRDHANCIT